MKRTLLVLLLAAALAGAALADRAPRAGALLAMAAARQVGVTTLYDPSYVRLAYPNGDVPMEFVSAVYRPEHYTFSIRLKR